MSGRGAYYKAKYGGGGRGGRQYAERGSASSHPYTKRAPQEDSFRSPGDYDEGAAGGASGKDLWSCLVSMEGKPYPAYKDIKGCWNVGEFSLYLDKQANT